MLTKDNFDFDGVVSQSSLSIPYLSFNDNKSLLDFLYYHVNKQRDFKVCFLKKKNDNSIVASKHYFYSQLAFNSSINDNKGFDFKNASFENYFLQKVNNRQIFNNEIVLDFENFDVFKNFLRFYKLFFRLLSGALEHVEGYVFFSGSRGLHVHFFFDFDVNKDDVLKKSLSLLGADACKGADYSLIALENAPHWKTNKKKTLLGVLRAGKFFRVVAGGGL